jgi:hypothetical protein
MNRSIMPATPLQHYGGSRGLHLGLTVVFYLLGARALGSLVSVLAIPANAIDYDLARGLDDAVPGRQGSTGRQPSGL